MMQILKAGLLYFALVFGVGFLLSTIRTFGSCQLTGPAHLE
jgi:hypothetical protein